MSGFADDGEAETVRVFETHVLPVLPRQLFVDAIAKGDALRTFDSRPNPNHFRITRSGAMSPSGCAFFECGFL